MAPVSENVSVVTSLLNRTPDLTHNKALKEQQTTRKSSAPRMKNQNAPRGQRPRSPLTAACDVPLCSVREGATPGTYWFVAEMVHKNGGVCKSWKYFSPMEVAAAKAEGAANMFRELESVAWATVQKLRAARGDSAETQRNLTPEEDGKYLAEFIAANLGELPSVVRNRAKFARLRDRRRAAGGPCDRAVRKGNSSKPERNKAPTAPRTPSTSVGSPAVSAFGSDFGSTSSNRAEDHARDTLNLGGLRTIRGSANVV